MTTTAQLIESFITRFKNNLNTTLPAVVTEVVTEGDNIVYISAKPVNLKVYVGGEIFERQEISNIPLIFPSSSEGIISYPVKVGDPVLLLFSQEDIDKFLHEGVTNVAPNTLRRFSLSDTMAIPCIHPTTSEVKPHKDNFQITFNDFKLSVTPSGDVSVETNTNVSITAEDFLEVDTELCRVTADKVKIGNGSVELISYLSDLTDEISKITVGGTPIDNKAMFEELKAQIDELI